MSLIQQNISLDMDSKVIVIRHPKENIKKCSLRFLHDKDGFEFHKANDNFSFDATGCILLEIDAPPITEDDKGKPILLLDSTWRLLPKIRNKVYGNYIARSIPPSVKTAYPRISKIFADPDGLATVEALYAAMRMAGNPDVSVLKHYPFAKKFMQINNWLGDLPTPDYFSEEESALCD